MLRWLEHQDWEKAFMTVIPKRKSPETQESRKSEVGGQEDAPTLNDPDRPQDSESEEFEEVDGQEIEDDLDITLSREPLETV
jgi:tRNA (guanine9-N1)-methyltransferase